MKTNTTPPSDKGFRFPPEMISHAVWLSFRFSLRFRSGRRTDDAQSGIVVTYETVRQWCLTFGQTDANELRRRRPQCGDKWHLDARVFEDQRENALPLEGCGPGWQCARYPCPQPTQHTSGETLF